MTPFRLIVLLCLIGTARATVPIGDVGGIPKHILQVLLYGTVGDPISLLGKDSQILTQDMQKLDINTEEKNTLQKIMDIYYGEARALPGSAVGDKGNNQENLIVTGVLASDLTDTVIEAAMQEAQKLGVDPAHLQTMRELNNQVIRNLMFRDVITKLKQAGAGSLTLTQRKALSNQIEGLKADMRNQNTVNSMAASILKAIQKEQELTRLERGAAVVAARQALGVGVDYNYDTEDYGGAPSPLDASYDFIGTDHLTYEDYLRRYGRGDVLAPSQGNPADPATAGNGSLVDAAYGMIGTSTAGIPGTDGGNLGCAAAVSMMFKQATGQDILPGQSLVLGTNELYSGLSNDPRFVMVPLDQAQAGDIVVTARGNRAGHTGIVGNNGEIISNSSGGFNGSSPGTIQQNYTVAKWEQRVAPRNPGETAAFRYVGG